MDSSLTDPKPSCARVERCCFAPLHRPISFPLLHSRLHRPSTPCIHLQRPSPHRLQPRPDPPEELPERARPRPRHHPTPPAPRRPCISTITFCCRGSSRRRPLVLPCSGSSRYSPSPPLFTSSRLDPPHISHTSSDARSHPPWFGRPRRPLHAPPGCPSFLLCSATSASIIVQSTGHWLPLFASASFWASWKRSQVPLCSPITKYHDAWSPWIRQFPLQPCMTSGIHQVPFGCAMSDYMNHQVPLPMTRMSMNRV
ncbi:hypothetical protein VPH35_110940 [Triticum aestivum]